MKKKISGTMKKKRFVQYLIALFIGASIITILFYYTLASLLARPEMVRSIDMRLEIRDIIGVNADKDSLNFGVAGPGSTMKKSLNITNTKPYDLHMTFSMEGNITPFIVVEDTVIRSKENKAVNVFAVIPGDAVMGNIYSGNLIVEFYKK